MERRVEESRWREKLKRVDGKKSEKRVDGDKRQTGKVDGEC